MKPEHQHLLDDLWESDSNTRREATLQAGKAILRRKRQIRFITRLGAGGLCAATLVGILWMFGGSPTPKPAFSAQSPTPALAPAPATNTVHMAANDPKPKPPAIKDLTDDELLARFPGIPVGITIVNGRKCLIFPRPEDQQKYVLQIDTPSPMNGI
jgi:hypothetical protein